MIKIELPIYIPNLSSVCQYSNAAGLYSNPPTYIRIGQWKSVEIPGYMFYCWNFFFHKCRSITRKLFILLYIHSIYTFLFRRPWFSCFVFKFCEDDFLGNKKFLLFPASPIFVNFVLYIWDSFRFELFDRVYYHSIGIFNHP